MQFEDTTVSLNTVYLKVDQAMAINVVWGLRLWRVA